MSGAHYQQGTLPDCGMCLGFPQRGFELFLRRSLRMHICSAAFSNNTTRDTSMQATPAHLQTVMKLSSLL